MKKIAIITDSCSDIKKNIESYMIYMFYQYKFNMMERVIEMV